ncbi:MAG: hypothetical protein QM765_32685 [Myxococcales bacterium]
MSQAESRQPAPSEEGPKPPAVRAAPIPPAGRSAGWRLLPQLEKNATLLKWARTLPGRLVLVACFTGLFALTGTKTWPLTGVVLALISVAPKLRRLWLLGAALGWIFLSPPLSLSVLRELAAKQGAPGLVSAWPAVVACILAFSAGYVSLVRRWPKSVLGRHPVAGLILLVLALLAASGAVGGAASVLLAAAAMVLGRYLWFFAYSVCAGLSKDTAPFATRLGFLRPFWGFTLVPFGKGSAYLQKVEAADDEQFAVAQLKGLKLLVWALALSLVLELLTAIDGSGPGGWLARLGWHPAPLLPSYPEALESVLQGRPVAWGLRWLALIVFFLEEVTNVAVFGHLAIATARMAGFNAFRNTYRPFASTSIAEFYNRFYYYFKELLVDCFFFPTYFAYFRKSPRLRLFFATLVSAGLGNFLFHFLRDDAYIFRLGFGRALVAYQAYALYALILGVAIGISQARSLARKRKAPTGVRRILAIAGVLTFYCLVSIVDGTDHEHTIADYARYLASLFGF